MSARLSRHSSYIIRRSGGGWRVVMDDRAAWPRCDCGQPAVHQVVFTQLTVEQDAVTSALALCDACLADYLTIEKPLSVAPLTALTNEQGIIQRSEEDYESTECY